MQHVVLDTCPHLGMGGPRVLGLRDDEVGGDGGIDASVRSAGTTLNRGASSAAGGSAFATPVAYRLHPETHTPVFADPSDEGLRLAPFAQHALWVTRARDGERDAGGDRRTRGR